MHSVRFIIWCLQRMAQFCYVYCNCTRIRFENVLVVSGIRTRDIPINGTHAILQRN